MCRLLSAEVRNNVSFIEKGVAAHDSSLIARGVRRFGAIRKMSYLMKLVFDTYLPASAEKEDILKNLDIAEVGAICCHLPPVSLFFCSLSPISPHSFLLLCRSLCIAGDALPWCCACGIPRVYLSPFSQFP